jgi:AraC-like DNA-binding protein
MYSNLSFAIMLLGLFSIFEISKGSQKLSVLKLYILGRLVIVTTGSGMDFFGLNGNEIPYYREIYKTIAEFLTINLFFLIVVKKIPKLVIGVEIFVTLLLIIEIFYGFELLEIKDGVLQNKPTLINVTFYLQYFLLGVGAFIYNAYILFVAKRVNNNLYEIYIKKWVGTYMIAMIIIAIFNISIISAIKNGKIPLFDNSMIIIFLHRFMFILFVLYRPKFLDDDKYARPFNQILVKSTGLNFKNFEFLFYSNHYYLRQDASLEDLALKLNISKNQLLDFLKNELDEHFTELINKNRIQYLREMLKAKKYESFTIEALSEMSGFNNRRSMYYAFNKYIGMTPTEYIESIN